MADITFNQFLDEQKKTTGSVNSLGETLREQLLGESRVRDSFDKDLLDSQKEITQAVKESRPTPPTAADIIKGSLPEVLATYDTYKKEKEYATDPDRPSQDDDQWKKQHENMEKVLEGESDDDQWKKQHENMEKVLEANKRPYEALTEIPKLLAPEDNSLEAPLGRLGEDIRETMQGFTFDQKPDKITEDTDEEQKSILERLAGGLNFIGESLRGLGKDTESASQRKEGKKDTESFTKKTFGKLGDTFKSGFKSLGKSFETFKSLAGTAFKAFLLAVGLFALIEFLQSPTWKAIREWIAENPLTGVLATIIAINVLFNLIISDKMKSFDILFSLTELENRRDYGNKLRDNLNELLKKDDIIKKEDKILLYKLYQKLKSEFEEIK